MKIDTHNHAIPREALDLLRTDPAFGASFPGDDIRLHDGFQFPLSDAFFDPKAKLAELAAHELDAAVLSIAPPVFFYDLPADRSEQFCAAANEGFVRFAEFDPQRFRWMAHVPLQDVDRSVKMLREAKRNGAVGVEIATQILGKRPDDPNFEPFWRTAEELDLLVMMHPWYNGSYLGLSDWYLQNAVGNPQETMIAGCRLICSGILDRMPRLKVMLVHGGGHLPYQLGRLRHAISVRHELAGVSPDPWSYIGRLVFDSLTHDEQAMAYLVDRVGNENVFVGTDLPFDMAPHKPISSVRSALGEEDAAFIYERNPKALFGFEGERALA